MRAPILALLVSGVSLVAGCGSTRPEAPDVERRVQARWADVVAAAQAPDTDAAAFESLVAFRDDGQVWRPAGAADVSAVRGARQREAARRLLADVRALLATVERADGRVIYEVEEYVVEAHEGIEWHVLRLAFEGDERVREAEAGLVATQQGFRLGRLER